MHARWTGLLCVILFGLAATSALGQGLTVQLPTYSFTTVGTTVMVPDQGSTLLGGIDRASDGRNEFGMPFLHFPPFKNQSIGQSRSAVNMSVTATIHDFDAMDQALLNSPSPAGLTSNGQRPGVAPAGMVAGRAALPRAADLAGHWLPEPTAAAGLTGTNLAAEQSRRVAQQQTRADEAEKYFERARQAEADGKLNVARIYYQMVARRAAGDLQHQALARLEAVGGGTPRVAQSPQ